LSDALAVLNKRERRIFETRRLAEEQITLVKLAEEFGVSRERVRQIEVSAFAKVQNAVKHHVAAMANRASAGALASNPLPWWEILTMDVTLKQQP
jgi:RNA polymerase sigma-32 factor